MRDVAPYPQDLRERLGALGTSDDDAIDLGHAALWLAALDQPQVGLARYESHLAELSTTLGGAVDTLAGKTAALQNLFFEQGYAGDNQTYDDEQNANLIRVIDRRKGLPVSLAILLIHAAKAVDWRVVGLSFPYHFLIRLDHKNERTVIDPFNASAVLTTRKMRNLLKSFDGDGSLRPGHYKSVSNRSILLRLQNNIKSRAVQHRRFDRAVELVERMLLFAPVEAALWRELGVLQIACGRAKDAIRSVEHYYSMARDEELRNDATELLQKIKSRLN